MSNPYPARFTDLLYGLLPGELALDCGCGPRRSADPQVVHLDVDPVYTGVDLWADGMALPFRNGAFTAILSQAVIEHVTDPQRYVDECRRVLRPQGVMYAEVAFIQPVHQAPHHYFNVTPYGLRWLFRDWRFIGDGTLGHFDETIAWLCREAGVKPPKVSRQVRDHQAAASGVWILAGL